MQEASRKVLGLVTARGGSKGLPRKNVRLVAGKPLINWTVDAAIQARRLDRVILSTDDPEIAAVAAAAGAEVPFMRPIELAQDKSTHIDVLVHALNWLAENEDYHPEYVVTLQPTSPLRLAEDIDGSVELALSRSAKAVIGVCEAQSHPYRVKKMSADGVLHDFVSEHFESLMRQDWPNAYWSNGALYVNHVKAFLEERTMFPKGMLGYEMPVSRSLDIDTAHDLFLAGLLLEERQHARRAA